MTLTTFMWVVPLPLARITGLLVVAALAVVGLLKRKAIAAFTGAVWKAANKWLWGFVHRQLQTVEPSSSAVQNEKRYCGIYRGGYQVGVSGGYFKMEIAGKLTTVPISQTNLLAHLSVGKYAEIDTVVVRPGVEVVQRVHETAPQVFGKA
ncbi:MAG TPA: hypothetical protein VFN26_11545 [Candidatus Acidoferrum sp.]|nr:hypothetical protein [Candidatus Acidoferrum sp.]